MPKFSERSQRNLDTCHPLIKSIMREAIGYVDFSVTEGYRGKEAQNEAYRRGLSKLQYPESKHNEMPSKAVHIIPYPFHGWDNLWQFVYLAGYVKAVSDRQLRDSVFMLRWGGNWDMDTEVVTDQEFDDLAHFELVQAGVEK